MFKRDNSHVRSFHRHAPYSNFKLTNKLLLVTISSMNRQNTISIQEVRKNPLAFLRQINEGKTMVVIYHSKPFATVISADTVASQDIKSTKRMLEYAKLARDSAHDPIAPPSKSYKELYAEDMAKKYGIS